MPLTFTYDGVSSATYIDLIIRRYRFLTPPSIIREIHIPKKAGIHFFDRSFNKGVIGIETLIKGTSEADLLSKIDDLNEFLHKDDPKQLIFSDEPTRHFNALFANRTQIIDRVVWHARIDLEFHCFDPFGYANTQTEVQQSCTTIPKTFNVSNVGNYYAQPTITITFNQSQTHIYVQNNNITDCRFDISKSFSNGDVLIVNSKNMKVTLNGVYSPAGFGDGGDNKAGFILLRVGNNEIEVGTDDATLNVDISVKFNKTYL